MAKKKPIEVELPKNLVVFHGEEWAPRDAGCQKLVRRSRFSWRRVWDPQPGELEEIGTPGFGESTPEGVWVRVTQTDPAWFGDLHAAGGLFRLILVEFDGEVPERSTFRKLLKQLDPGRVFHFPRPKPWEARPKAIEYGRSVLSDLHLQDEGAVSLLVGRGVVELGQLTMELRKLAWYVGDRKGVTPQDVEGVGSFYGRSSLDDFLEVLGLRDLRKMVGFFDRVRQTEPIMKVVAGIVRVGYQWGCVGAHPGSDEECGADMGLHPFVVKKLRPIATRWGRDAFRLVRLAGQVGMLVRKGARNPWVVLGAGLFELSDPNRKVSR